MMFRTAVREAVENAAEIITDGAADGVTAVDLRLAMAELREPTGEHAAELALVVALGAEYVCNVNDPDDGELIAELDDFAGIRGEDSFIHAWTQYIGTLA